MTDETDAYGVKINGVTFISLPAAWEAVKEASKDARDLALEEAAKVAKGDEASATEYYRGRVHAAAAIRALKG